MTTTLKLKERALRNPPIRGARVLCYCGTVHTWRGYYKQAQRNQKEGYDKAGWYLRYREEPTKYDFRYPYTAICPKCQKRGEKLCSEQA